MHPDVRVPNPQEPLERLLRAGARVLRGPFDEVGRLTTVLADPEGDELCLLVPPAGSDRAATTDPHAPGAVGRPDEPVASAASPANTNSRRRAIETA
jgi:hypothetical protein